MTTKQIVIALIQQDLKHYQLIDGLAQLGLDRVEEYHLEINTIICELMEAPEDIKDDWYDTYASFIYRNPKELVEIAPDSTILLAHICYKHLEELQEQYQRSIKSNT
ncbi:MAG: hypothetical protein CL840_19755 [Crocinitomicaceae bacterium]|nr:hypothetical protein [Crocinitomicaceae bacterium]|tara:strand:- start:193 stop:513 length:321 start_codon:yes stop_codon:yes gene_type:complete